MRKDDQELRRALRTLPAEVEPPTELKARIDDEILRIGAHPETRRRRLPLAIAAAAALVVITIGTMVGIGISVDGSRRAPGEVSLAPRVAEVRREVESIVASLEAVAPHDAQRLRLEFNRVLTAMSEVAEEIDRGRSDGESRGRLAALVDEHLRLLDHAVSLRLAGSRVGTE